VSATISKKAEAKLDLLQHFVYIGENNLEAAERFLSAAEDAFQKLAGMPRMGALRDFGNPELTGLRSWPIREFRNYLIFYRPIEDGIEVLRVLHGARDVERIFRPGSSEAGDAQR
jgi:toxin ParE1/3/4